MTHKTRPFALRSLAAGLALAASGLTFAACGGGGGAGGGGPLDLFVGNAARADLSGQTSAFQGDLGAGTTITFPCVAGQNYLISVETTDNDDEVVFDVYGADGSHLRSKTVDAPGGFLYQHAGKSQHVIVIARPWNPLDLGVTVTRLTVSGVGNFPQDRFHVNFFVVGKFAGYGAYNDLTSTADQAAFTQAVMAKVQSLFVQANITITFDGFFYSADQIRATDPSLIGSDDMALCSASEAVGSTGFGQISTGDLDRYGNFGMSSGAANFNQAHGIDVFLVHHFTNDGTVGLSPRPGIMTGNGPDTALACGAFLQFQSQLIGRTADEIGLVLAHELGHFLGLLHTTTFDPSPQNPSRSIDDGISDTPTNTVLTDGNGDGFVGVGDGCPDEGNVMFFQAATQTQFTAGQRAVMAALLSQQEH